MPNYRITGGQPLKGNLVISGRKNAALKLIAASVLSDQDVTIHRVPDIGDVRTLLQILQNMGAIVGPLENGTVTLNCHSVTDPVIPASLAKQLRASLVLVGPLLNRFGKAVFPHPGGCIIGRRSIDPHLEAFRTLGAQVEYRDDTYEVTSPQLTGADIYLKERSVTGTENAIMAALGAQGTTRIFNAAEERHIVNLCDLLRQMGFSITGDSTSTVTVEGRPGHRPPPVEVVTIADEIEVGTFAVAATLTHGDVTLEQVGTRLELFPIFTVMDAFNLQYQYDEARQTLRVQDSPDLRAHSFKPEPWPGFPSDLQSPFTILATQAQGTSLIHEWMYEGRIYFVSLLQKMGAHVVICDPHRALVTGPTHLYHSSLITPDLRAGAALVIAALVAEGTSTVEHAELIERGYGALDQRLGNLGAHIERVA
jgi:UDP-N-acetylglucosamine 1-carboxyvinyltransferase